MGGEGGDEISDNSASVHVTETEVLFVNTLGGSAFRSALGSGPKWQCSSERYPKEKRRFTIAKKYTLVFDSQIQCSVKHGVNMQLGFYIDTIWRNNGNVLV